jgi:hypothetical protein
VGEIAQLSRGADIPLSGTEAAAEILSDPLPAIEMRSRHVLALLLVATSASAQTTRVIPAPIEKYFRLVRAEYSGERAKELVAFMNARSRWPGNTAFDASLDQVISRLRAAGYVREDSAPKGALLTYRIETRPLRNLAWDQISGSLAIEGDAAPLLETSKNFNLIGINSWPTPDSGVVAEVVDVGRGTPADYEKVNVEGKVVLAETSLGRTYAEAVQRRRAIGALAFNLPSFNRPDVNRDIIQFTSIPFDSTRKAWGMPISHNTLDALRSRLKSGPVRVRVKINTRLFPSVQRTVIAEIRGTAAPQERFVFSAHVQEPGANDNASGVGAQAEMARVLALLAKNGAARPRRTITMIFGEEVAQTRQFLADDSARTRNVKWGISLDMVGEDTSKTGGTFLIEKMPDPSAVWTRGADHHTEWGGSPLTKDRIVPHYFNDFLLDRALDQASTNGWVVNTNPYEGGSDHSPFLQFKKPGVLFWHFTDQFYHTDGDRIEMVSPVTLRNVGVTAAVSALTLTNADGALTRDLIAALGRSAIRRLDTELALSQRALASGGKMDEQIDILQTWTDYYVGALEAMKEIEVGGSSAQTVLAIDAARSRVKAAGATRISQLR